MSDIEYSKRYAVYLTSKKGIRFLTNETSLKIMRSLSRKEMSVTDISKSMGTSKSSVQANLVKMTNMGLIEPRQCNEDGRKILYRTCSFCIIRDGGLEDWMINARRTAVKRIFADDGDHWSEAIVQFTVTLAELGVDMSPMLFEMGTAFGLILKDQMEPMSDKEVVKYLCMFLDDPSMNMDVECDERFHMVMRTDDDTAFNLFYMNNMITGFILSIMPYRKGYNYTSEVRRTLKDEGHTMDLSAERFEGDMHDCHLPSLLERDVFFYNVNVPFAIYRIEGSSMLFSNSTMIRIMGSLSEGAKTVKTMSCELDISAVTIHASLLKLMNLGAVSSDNELNTRNVKFKLEALKIVYTTEPTDLGEYPFKGFFDDFFDGRKDFFELAYEYFMKTCFVAGIAYEEVMYYIGKNLAKIVVEMHPDITAEEFLQMVCRGMVSPEQIKLESMIPIRYSFVYHDNSRYSLMQITNYIKGMAIEGIRLITGEDYNITIDVVHANSG